MTSNMFRPILVRLQHLPAYRYRQEEQMGTKAKLWLVHGRTGQRVMLKFARQHSGEDWSEKVASHIAAHIDVPCPRVELAFVEDHRQRLPPQALNAVLCWSFLRRRPRDSLIHGNELLLKADPTYPVANTYRACEHTIEAVHDVLQGYAPPASLALWPTMQTAFDAFIGYLMLDTLIGNTDRHHENWAVTSGRTRAGAELRLAPSYDHASSLGRELPDRKREARLGKAGRGTLAEYADKATSAFSDDTGAKKLSTLDALLRAARLRPDAFRAWRNRLHAVPPVALEEYVNRVPGYRLSTIGKEFAQKLIEYNYYRLVNLEP
jgi:hypothetical protein